MNIEFIFHLLISAAIIYTLVSWFKIFLNLRQTTDFSYVWIVIFWAYTSSLININFWFWILSSIFLSFLISIFFTFFILFLSSRLDKIYFVIWSLAFYMLILQIISNVEFTGWVLWLSWMNRKLLFWFEINSIFSFFIFSLILSFLIVLFFSFLKKTYFYKTLEWWWENENSIKSLWIKSLYYKFFIILITTFLAVIWWSVYAFYYQYISPSSFWIWMLLDMLIPALVTFKMNDSQTFLVCVLYVFILEWLRFVKFSDPSKNWYFIWMIFALIVMISSYFVFKRIELNRDI